jgi:hypothetical protein
MDEELLPKEIFEKAHISPGGEYAWRKEDIPSVLEAAKSIGLATIGGQPQFIVSEQICEVHWIGYDSVGRKANEPWETYVSRSTEEVLEGFRRVCLETDFRGEAMTWDLMRDKIEKEGFNPIDYLWFVLYFDSSGGNIEIAFELLAIGCLECGIRVGSSRANVTASYLSDALGDLLSGVIAMVRGNPSATITFWEEPGYFHWILERVSEERVRIQILGPPEEHVVLDDECPLRDLAVEVLSAFDRLKQKYGEEGYLAQWVEHKFPAELVEELRGLLEA